MRSYNIYIIHMYTELSILCLEQEENNESDLKHFWNSVKKSNSQVLHWDLICFIFHSPFPDIPVTEKPTDARMGKLVLVPYGVLVVFAVNSYTCTSTLRSTGGFSF